MSSLRNKSTKGFTLIELMIVVAIIGILAAIAIPNFLRFQLRSKTSEGKVNLAAIRTAEESFLAEYGTYVAALVSPVAAVGPQKIPYLVNTPGAGFDALGWNPEGDVFFQYDVTLVGAVAPGNQGYTATARADIDGDAVPQDWGYVHADPTGATVAGTNGATCVAGGVFNPATAAQDMEDTVGPCLGTYGQSIF
jgi:type IV pilus assembly protein PilA